jgi:hypothetical protein
LYARRPEALTIVAAATVALAPSVVVIRDSSDKLLVAGWDVIVTAI